MSHLASGVDPVPGFERLHLLGVYRYIMVHLVQSLFSVPVGLYSMARRLFACIGYLNGEGIPPVVEIQLESFAVWRAVRAVHQADHMSHLDGFTPLTRKSMPCERVVKLLFGVCDLLFWGMTFLPLESASLLLDSSLTISEASQTFFPLLSCQETPFKEAIYCLQFSYTADRTEEYMAPASTFLV